MRSRNRLRLRSIPSALVPDPALPAVPPPELEGRRLETAAAHVPDFTGQRASGQRPLKAGGRRPTPHCGRKAKRPDRNLRLFRSAGAGRGRRPQSWCEVLGPSKRPQTPLGDTSAAHHAEPERPSEHRLLCGSPHAESARVKPVPHLPTGRRPHSRVTRSAELLSSTPSPVPRADNSSSSSRLTPPDVTHAEPDAAAHFGPIGSLAGRGRH